MKRLLISGIAGLTFLLAAVAGQAQTGITQRGLPNGTDAYDSGLKLYYRTWSDLNHAQKNTVSNPGDWYRYDVARGQMDQLERAWRDGSFTTAQLNAAISDLTEVLNFNNLSPQDRDAVSRDLDQLRDVRIKYGR